MELIPDWDCCPDRAFGLWVQAKTLLKKLREKLPRH
jgi:hypothetical protein